MNATKNNSVEKAVAKNKNVAKFDYKTNVLETNKAFKDAVKSVNKGLKILIISDVLPKQMKDLANKILKDEAKYKEFCGEVRKTKNGQTTPFYIMQLLHKLTNK
jgi:nicotinate-nucleotide pyrophosphorylase